MHNVIYMASVDSNNETPKSPQREHIRDVIYVASEDDKDSGNEAYYKAKNADRARARALRPGKKRLRYLHVRTNVNLLHFAIASGWGNWL